MSSIYQPCRPRASPLWQIIHHGWGDFLVDCEQRHRKSLGRRWQGHFDKMTVDG